MSEPKKQPVFISQVIRLGKLGAFVIKNTNFHTIGRAIAYVKRHGYHALRGKMLYKFSRKDQSEKMPMLRTQLAWHMDQDLYKLDTPISGRFRFPANKLKLIEVQTVTAGHIPGRLQLTLFEADGTPVQECIIPGTQVLDGDFTHFPFEPIPDSESRIYRFELKALEKPYPSIFYHKEAPLRDITLDIPGSINCRIFADDWKGDEYDLWIRKCEPVFTELEEQKRDHFPISPKISILVPMYKTPLPLFQDMLHSVLEQTYGNWELCLGVAGEASNEKHLGIAGVASKEKCSGVAGEVSKEKCPGDAGVTNKEKCLGNAGATAIDNGGKGNINDPGKSDPLWLAVQAAVNADSRIQAVQITENQNIVNNTNAAAALATGEFIALLDHDDLLAPFALHAMVKAINDNPQAEMLYSDEDKISEDGKNRFNPHFKPDFAPDNLRSYNYICHFSMIKKSLFDKVGQFRPGYDGSQDYDLFLRVTEQAKKVVHVPQVLYHWRETENSTARNVGVKPYVLKASENALKAHLERIGKPGRIAEGVLPTTFDIRFDIKGSPKVSVIIPNKDHASDLKKCLISILEKTTWANYEILIVENNSTDPATFRYYETLKSEAKIRVIHYQGAFNFSAINNLAAKEALGEHLLLLNNDTEVISPEWMTRLLEESCREEVGAVGAKLYYPDNTIQHAGVILGLNTLADHAFRGVQKEVIGYFGRTHLTQNASIVTAACMMIKKSVYFEMGGLDETFPIAFNDVDLCMKIRQKGYLIVFTPYAELYHYESKSRGQEDTPKKKKRFHGEVMRFYARWGLPHELRDPYYNPNLLYEESGYEISV